MSNGMATVFAQAQRVLMARHGISADQAVVRVLDTALALEITPRDASELIVAGADATPLTRPR